MRSPARSRLRCATWVGTDNSMGQRGLSSASSVMLVFSPSVVQSPTMPLTGFSRSPREGRTRWCRITCSGGISHILLKFKWYHKIPRNEYHIVDLLYNHKGFDLCHTCIA